MASPFKPLAFIILALCAVSAHAMSMQAFEAMTNQEQAKYITGYVFKMRTDIANQNPELAQAIVTWFTHTPQGKPLSDGAEALLIEELRVDRLAKQGKADLSKIQIEGLIVYVVKQHFKS